MADDLYAAEVRAAEALWVSRGINGVPAVVVDGKWLISGGQSEGVLEEALRGRDYNPRNSLIDLAPSTELMVDGITV